LPIQSDIAEPGPAAEGPNPKASAAGSGAPLALAELFPNFFDKADCICRNPLCRDKRIA
jgi:hypothetical protein